MAQCPRCKEDLPLLSQICTVCGYVHEGSSGDDDLNMSVDEFANALEVNLRDIKKIPQPSFLNSMAQLTFIIFPILAIYMLVLAVVSEAGLFWILFGLFFILSIVCIIKKARGTLGNDKFNRRFKMIKSDFEYTSRVASRKFGRNKEVSNLLADIQGEINTIEKKRRGASARNLLIWVVVLILFFVAGGFGVLKTDQALNPDTAADKIEAAMQSGDWQAAIDQVKGMSEDDPNIEKARVDAIATTLTNGNNKAAEDFFVDYCMGNMQDFECAKFIVNYYVDTQNKEAASAFVDRCTKMRYKSDVQKLRKLIK